MPASWTVSVTRYVAPFADTDFLDARIELDEARLLAFDASADLAAIRSTPEAIPLACRGEPDAGPALEHLMDRLLRR